MYLFCLDVAIFLDTLLLVGEGDREGEGESEVDGLAEIIGEVTWG